MQNIQEIFNRIQKTKKEQKGIKLIYRDALLASLQYQKIIEKIKDLKEKKKKIEESIKDDFRSEFSKLDTLKLDIENDNMLLSDIALSEMLKGKSINLTDQNNNKYEPIFNVRFKKAG